MIDTLDKKTSSLTVVLEETDIKYGNIVKYLQYLKPYFHKIKLHK